MPGMVIGQSLPNWEDKRTIWSGRIDVVRINGRTQVELRPEQHDGLSARICRAIEEVVRQELQPAVQP
jgi:hypothetical protein